MSPEAAHEEPEAVTVEPDDTEYRLQLVEGSKVYELLEEAGILDEAALRYWQLSAHEQEPYIELGRRLQSRMDAVHRQGVVEGEDNVHHAGDYVPAAAVDLLYKQIKQLNARVVRLVAAQGLREADASIAALELSAEDD